MITDKGVLAALPEGRRAELMALADAASYPEHARIFDEGGSADRFWVVRTGTVALDVHIPGRGRAIVDTVGPGDLLGWSWLCPPHQWHLGAVASTDVEAWEFEAAPVRRLCERDPALGQALAVVVAGVIGHRLRSARTRLLDLYGPPGTEPLP
ncbi:cyclic nucleotide-binding domain-containing protein [Streptomyces sp. NPDC001922]|uniref:cyclic nucleotide-binding domain-containing protein n=1 Tax=Streptomyces sp. NPDC001922 TaxID=3364624 RepID=UPI0036C4B63F